MRGSNRFIIAALGFALGGCPNPPPPPSIDAVMSLPASASELPILVPQSLGGEYRALPESNMVGRGLAFDLSDVSDISTVEVFVDGIQVAPGVTNGILSAGQPPVFSITQTVMGPRLTLLLALTSSDPRQATTVAIAGGPNGRRSSVVIDTPSHSIATRPEPSDKLLFSGIENYYWWQPIYPGGRDPKYAAGRDVLLAGWLMPADESGNAFSSNGTFNSGGSSSGTAPSAVSRNCSTGSTTAGPSPRGFCEDIHYTLLLDANFLARIYGRSDRTTSLTSAMLTGNSANGDTALMPLADTLGNSGSSAITINSFQIHNGTCGFHLITQVMPWMSLSCLKGEQPVWHVDTTPPTSATYFGAHTNGLGPPPPGWKPIPTESTYDPNTYYAFHPSAGIEKGTRMDASRQLYAGDYVLVKATLWQDGPHGYAAPSCFPTGSYNDGWMEFHVIDWITKVPPPRQTTTAALIARCLFSYETPQNFDEEVAPPPEWLTPHNAGDTLHYCLLVDERFTTAATLSGLQTQPGSQSDRIRVQFNLTPMSGSNSSLMASIVMWWADAADQSLDPACFGLNKS